MNADDEVGIECGEKFGEGLPADGVGCVEKKLLAGEGLGAVEKDFPRPGVFAGVAIDSVDVREGPFAVFHENIHDRDLKGNSRDFKKSFTKCFGAGFMTTPCVAHQQQNSLSFAGANCGRCIFSSITLLGLLG